MEYAPEKPNSPKLNLIHSAASMTTYATRSPLQPLLNLHMMSQLRRSSRRTSATLAQKEDPSVPNGAPGEKEGEKLGPTNGSIAKLEKVAVNGNKSKTTGQRGKRKLGQLIQITRRLEPSGSCTTQTHGSSCVGEKSILIYHRL